jgi:hypothetical protein
MGFWSTLGNIVKTAAPFIAAPFTGGLSIPIGMAVNSGIGAATGALGGGGLKGALVGAAGGALPGAGGILGKAVGGALGTAANAGVQMGGRAALGGLSPSQVPGMENGGIAGRNPNGTPSGVGINMSGPTSTSVTQYGAPRPPNGIQMGGLSPTWQQAMNMLGPTMGAPNQNNPNLADAITQGRMSVMQNRPWQVSQ